MWVGYEWGRGRECVAWNAEGYVSKGRARAVEGMERKQRSGLGKKGIA